MGISFGSAFNLVVASNYENWVLTADSETKLEELVGGCIQRCKHVFTSLVCVAPFLDEMCMILSMYHIM